MWDAQLAMWSGSGGRGPLPKASRRGTGFFFVVHGIESMLGNLLEPGLSKQRGRNSVDSRDITSSEVEEGHGRQQW